MVIGTHVVLYLTAGFFKNNTFASKMYQKCGFWNLSEKLDINFFVILIYIESLYYPLYSCTNPIFGGNLVPEICHKMRLAKQIAQFLNQLDL